ncbi:MAG: trypsin-like peptidase domain-containing protein, partial [Bacteroidales bacterium]|nr:trypsin-like peptidase domain-containing protein [Bacteroidales bacterium]
MFTANSETITVINDPEPAPVQQAGFTGYAPVDGPDFIEAASKTVDAVVHIRSQFYTKSDGYDDYFGALREYLGYERRPNRSYPISGWGSGVILSSDGYIVTNNHVVEDAEEIKVRCTNHEEYDAKIIGRDPKTDVALIKIEPRNGLTFIHFGDSDKLRVGEWVVAIGNPFGFENTVTAGIVSGKGRTIGGGPYENFIQTDASI